MKNKLRKYWPTILTAFIALAIFLPSVVLAQAKQQTGTSGTELGFTANLVIQAVGAIVQMLINVLGKLTVALIHILIMVAGYNEYMTSPAITTGWVIVRDVANLFFVALILVVSIGSIVNPERFGGVKKVFRVLLYALLVNFSRTIAGLFIDISQLVMLTFVNGFAQAAGGNFVEALGITKITDVSPGTTGVTFSASMGQLLLGLFMFVIITVIIAVMVVALVVRMVTLWMLVVLSPLAFALGSSDLTKQHYAEWWKKFSAELTTGPIVAFFLWLSLITFQSSAGPDSGSKIVGPSGLQDNAAGKEPITINCGDAVACEQNNLIRFIVASVMLLAGLGFAKDFSGLGGSLAKSAAGAGQKYARGALNWAGKKTWGATKKVAGVGLSATGIPLATNKIGDQYNRLKGHTGRWMGRASTSNNWAVRNLVGTLTRPASIALTTSAGKRDAEKDKKAREALQYASPEALSGVITSVTTTDAEKRAASMKILKDREYVGARSDSADPQEVQRAAIFERAAARVRNIRPGVDKDMDDIVKDGREKRPDAFWDPHDPHGRNQDAQIAAAGAGLSRDEFFKLDTNGMTDHDLQTLVSGIRPQVMEAIMGRATGRQMDRLHQLVLPAGAPAPTIDTAITGGVVNWSRARVDNAPVVPAGGGVPPAPTVNGNIAERVTQRGSSVQINQLIHNPEIDRVRADIRDRFNAVVDPRTGAGINPATGRIDDGNLRLAEARVMLDPGSMDALRDTYRVMANGNFATPEMRRSYQRSVETAPQKAQFVMSLPTAMIDASHDITLATVDNLTTADLDTMAQMASTDTDIATRFQALLTAIQNISPPAGTPPGAPMSARQAIADGLNRYAIAHPDIVTFRR